MVSLIIGNKGTGKTKRLVSMVNAAVETSKGDVVCIEKGPMLTYTINHGARLCNTASYGVDSYDKLLGFISGICAGNYDVTDIFVDSTIKIGGKDYALLSEFLCNIGSLAKKIETKFVIIVSAEQSDLSEKVFESCKVI
jgi:hypothetical protein